ncbi:MAG: hypothetical protein ACT6RD_06030 [Brevundimonas sp.]|uniref:hypothetical protein n=1 Tax=Brevundimonas sp. TaxID=1871086 RepID=UPI004033F9AA
MSRPRFSRVSGLALLIALGLAPTAQAQDLFGRLLDRARERVEQEAERQMDRALRPEEPRRDPGRSDDRRGPPPGPAQRSAPTARLGVAGPSATTIVSSSPQPLWLNVGRGQKFEPVDGPPQLLSTNPYLAPPAFLFERIGSMACAPDGGLVVSGRSFETGTDGPVGWWRIAADGAVTPIATYDAARRTTEAPYHEFSLAGDGSLLSSSAYALYRVRDGVSERIAGPEGETSGYRDGPASAALFDRPGVPIEDGQGNIWVADQNDCVLRRITPDGQVSTVLGRDRTACEGVNSDDVVSVRAIVWDAANAEIVAAGITGVASGAHDFQTMIWRIRPDGSMRRVYQAYKRGSGSASGQTMDGVQAVAVEPSGAIVIASRDMDAYARRQLLRLDERTGRLTALTGRSYSRDVARPGLEEDPYDGPAARANFRDVRALCRGPDGTLFALDEHLVRRLNTDGTVRTWVY